MTSEIWYHGKCDRLNCERATKHTHSPDDPLKVGAENYRPKLPSFRLEGTGLYSNIMSVRDLVVRLLELDLDDRISFENEQLLAVGDTETVVFSRFHPQEEHFNKNNELM